MLQETPMKTHPGICHRPAGWRARHGHHRCVHPLGRPTAPGGGRAARRRRRGRRAAPQRHRLRAPTQPDAGPLRLRRAAAARAGAPAGPPARAGLRGA